MQPISFPLESRPAPQAAPQTPAARPQSPPVPADQVQLGAASAAPVPDLAALRAASSASTAAPAPLLGTMRELPKHFAVASLPQGWDQPDLRSRVADELVERLQAYPSSWATVAMAPQADGTTKLMVASRPEAAAQSSPEGIYGIVAHLASSPLVKDAVAEHGGHSSPPVAVAGKNDVYEMTLPGQFDESSLMQAVAEGCLPNRKDQLKALLDGLPQDKRAVVLLGGPSGAGKTSLIKELTQLAGDRKVVAITGDMYFRDMDDPEYPMTSQGAYDWDNPHAMHVDELARDISQLIEKGTADMPIYDFTAVPKGGWRRPVQGVTGARQETKQHLELGANDILVIDSLHATNEAIVSPLNQTGLPHVSLYLDSPRSEDRLLRRIVRDYATREGTAERTISYWDLSTFPGEVHFIRPTLTQLDPSHDLYYVTRFGTDLGLTREQIEHKTAKLAEYGLTPTYAAFGTPDEKLPEFRDSEKARFEGIIANSKSTDAERAMAQRSLDKLLAAMPK